MFNSFQWPQRTDLMWPWWCHINHVKQDPIETSEELWNYMASSGLQWPRRSDPMWSGPPFVGSRNKSYKCTFVPRGHLHGASLSPNFHMFNDLQRPPMASEVGSDVIRSPICGVKEQKLLVHFCSQRPPSWCFIESKCSHVQWPPAASNGLGGRIRCDPVPHLWGQGTKVISNFFVPVASFMVFHWVPFSHVEWPPAASNGLGGQTSCNTTPPFVGSRNKSY